jgi:hypothetical protein
MGRRESSLAFAPCAQRARILAGKIVCAMGRAQAVAKVHLPGHSACSYSCKLAGPCATVASGS